MKFVTSKNTTVTTLPLEEKWNQKDCFIRVWPDNIDDIYTLYSIIFPSDLVEAFSVRKVAKTVGNVVHQNRVMGFVTVQVLSTELLHSEGVLRIKGIVINGPDQGMIGRQHTIECMTNEVVGISKIPGEWMLCDCKNKLIDAVETVKGIFGIIVVLNKLSASIALVSHLITSVEVSINSMDDSYESLLNSFDNVVQPFVNASKRPRVIIASPGFYANQFLKKLPKDLVSKFDVSSIHVHEGIPDEIPEIVSKEFQLHGGSQINQEECIERILYTMARNPDLVVFGEQEVDDALSFHAIDELFIADDYIRIVGPTKYSSLLERLEIQGGKYTTLSVRHPSGEQLVSFGRLVALLRFKIE
eukprot:TRINITY_DN1563_c0_g2_i1.p1 TRINITY_DN1563_c0_g2~~TRINITY_DN1563_c0_g2_i1.p1  ORF type:complete len:368 (+),score=87.76 TRINITY_DN1563_c0_g2_i1:32-1105(+)